MIQLTISKHLFMQCLSMNRRRSINWTTDVPVYRGIPDSKAHDANMGPILGRPDPGGPPVDPINFAIWDVCITGPQ